VKLGTITPDGKADVYSYAPDEDCEVLDPHLARHLAHWGINVGLMRKTERSLAEMEVDLNQAYDWSRVPNPFEGFGPDETRSSLAGQLVAEPESAKLVATHVKAKSIAADVFRLALMDAYSGACAFCGLRFFPALEAAHIKPWRYCTPRERLDPRNGLLLCANHHGLFDNDALTITEDRTLDFYTAAYRIASETWGNAAAVADAIAPLKNFRLETSTSRDSAMKSLTLAAGAKQRLNTLKFVRA